MGAERIIVLEWLFLNHCGNKSRHRSMKVVYYYVSVSNTSPKKLNKAQMFQMQSNKHMYRGTHTCMNKKDLSTEEHMHA